MRRVDKQRPAAEAWALFSRAAVVHLAGVTPSGEPLVRPLHGVVHGEALVFHGARVGDKVHLVGTPVVATASEVVAEIPSHLTHPERACPATTFYRSAMLHGTLARVDDPQEKASALQALMVRFQPAGGYRAIRADDPLHAKGIRGTEVWRLAPGRIAAKAGLGQRKPEAWRTLALAWLWQDGQVDAVRDLAEVWDLPLGPAPDGARLILPDDRHRADAVALLRDQYWNQDVDDPQIARAQRDPWVGAVDTAGRLVATARALTDTAKLAYLMDVAVDPAWQGRGVGRAVVRQLLDHPLVRDCPRWRLHTRDAGGFYEGLGFERLEAPPWRIAYGRRGGPAEPGRIR